ncbi:methylmalonyl-CoA epimerase [Pseudomonas sp. ADAK22]|uniref:VOC family protein n=1 Tax=Pseudomonas sp. ADAK22 TaxID=2730851 RepID=UPI0014639F23|nr:VOC family protein [Pseudomonas sp. ADAK22]QJI12823.1 methylmalonyl-CoA epimerase [Pseudomonas sp. ADAK22]
MELTFSHVDVLVEDLEQACAYYANIFNANLSTTQVWNRGGFHVRYAVVLMGQERFMLVQPLAGNLRELLDAHGEGMIYRHCYTTPDIEVAYAELVAKGVQPEDENGRPLALEDLQSPSGTRIIWLPKRFGHFSIEILEEKGLQAFMQAAFA